MVRDEGRRSGLQDEEAGTLTSSSSGLDDIALVMIDTGSRERGMWRSLGKNSSSYSIRALFDYLRHSRGIASSMVSYPGAFGAMVPLQQGSDAGGWELMEFEGKFFLAVCDCDFPQDRVESAGWEDMTEFHFALSGPVAVSSDAKSDEGEGLSVFICRMGREASYRVTCAKGRRRSIALLVHNTFMDVLLEHDSKLAEELGAVGDDEVYMVQLPINQKLASLVDAIVSNSFDERRRLVYAEGKCQELLCETIEPWRNHQASPVSRLTLRPRDVAMLEKARGLIVSNLARPANLRELACQLGTNTSKLTMGFRAINGITINQFALNARMDRALHLLSMGDKAVADVAEEVGYSHQSSFAKAFTKHFGFPPSKTRGIAAP